jgi:predicted HTH transcriptional regulator
LIAEIRRSGTHDTFDELPLPELDSEAIDFRAASEFFPQRTSLTKVDLQTLRLVARHGRRLVPTVGGLLLFGKRPEERFPDAWIQCGRFQGTTKATLLDRLDARGNLARALETAYGFVQRHAAQGLIVEGLKHAVKTSQLLLDLSPGETGLIELG